MACQTPPSRVVFLLACDAPKAFRVPILFGHLTPNATFTHLSSPHLLT